MWTINDFLGYGSLSGWSTKGYMACPCCNEQTSSKRLSSKIYYMGHRRYLPLDHGWRRSKLFDGQLETRSKLQELSGEDVLQKLDRLQDLKYGKHPNLRKKNVLMKN